MSGLSNQAKAEICKITCGRYPIRHSKDCPWHQDRNSSLSPEQTELEALRDENRRLQQALELLYRVTCTNGANAVAEDMDFLKQEYRDSEDPMTDDALELKARLKILQERDELRAEVRRLKIEIAVLTNTPTGQDIITVYKQAEAENASLKEELEQAEAALGEMQAAFSGVLDYACDRLEEVLTDPKNYTDHDFTDLSFTREYVAALAQSVIDDDVRNELQEAIFAAKDAKEYVAALAQSVIDDDVRNELQEAIFAAKDAKAAGERWRAMKDFDVLLCINEATKWPDPPPMDERWIKAICKAADLVKQGMLAAYELKDLRKYKNKT